MVKGFVAQAGRRAILPLLVISALFAGLAWAAPGQRAAATPSADTTAPTTQVIGADGLWHNVDVTLGFVASDENGGSGVAATYYAVDGGAYVPGTSVTVPAPADHSNDRVHVVDYYSVDVAGNAETPKTCVVGIDTAGPDTELRTSGGAGGVAFTIGYRLSDALSAGATSVRLVVSDGHGKVVRRFAWAARPLAKWLTVRWRPLSQDAYTFRLTAKDEAGNVQARAADVKVFARGAWWRTIGRSVLGRTIAATRFGSGPRRVLLVGGVHGNERGTAVAGQFVTYLVTHPKAVPAGAMIEILRCLNPDGFARGTRGNARRVDLNRNLPTRDWRGRLLPGSEPGGPALSGGSAPGSEPETKSLLALLRNGGFAAVVSLHSRAGMLICEGPGSRDLGRRMSPLCGLPIGRLSYEAAITGSLGTFVPEKYRIPSVTVELRSSVLSWGLAAALVAVAR